MGHDHYSSGELKTLNPKYVAEKNISKEIVHELCIISPLR